MPGKIIVSDLHVDTWDARTYGKGDRRKTKLDHWSDFLDWCDAGSIDELIVNGDLMDAPPYEGDECLTKAPARGAVDKLLAYARKHRVTYIYGNHDIGISGLRCRANSGLAALGSSALLYPSYEVRAADTLLLLEHGHTFDPGLALYIRDLFKRTYLPNILEAVHLIFQRRDLETRERIQDPGVAPPTTVDPSLVPPETEGVPPENALYWAIRVTNGLYPSTYPMRSSAAAFLTKLKDGVFHKIADSVKHYLWWEAAQRIFRDRLGHAGPKPKKLYSLMGHTHVPDEGHTTVAGVTCFYFNSGTWTGAGPTAADRSYATYLHLREDGDLRLYDWIWSRS